MDQFKAAIVGDLQYLRVALTVNNVNDVDDSEDGLTALHCAVNSGHFDCVKLCVEMGANVNTRALEGWTPLHVVSSMGRINFVRVLLDTGAIVDAADNDGETPLYDAISKNHVDIAHLLIDRGAKVSSIKMDIPDWVTTFIESRSNCRFAAITIIGVHKYRRTTVTGNNDINVLRLISKHIWSTRMDGV
jgi:ankyrin repeat protein